MVGSLLHSRFSSRHAGALRDDSKNGRVTDYMVGGTNLPPTVMSVNFRNLEELYPRLKRITFKLSNFTNFKALFPLVLTDFP